MDNVLNDNLVKLCRVHGTGTIDDPEFQGFMHGDFRSVCVGQEKTQG